MNPDILINNVCLYGAPRNGTTLLRMILKYLSKNVESSHIWFKTELPIVIVYRDPRDVAVSIWRFNEGTYDKDGKLTNRMFDNEQKTNSLICRAKAYMEETIRCIDYYKDRKNAWIIRYRDFYNNYDFIFSGLEKLLNIYISDRLKNKIIENTKIDYIKKIQNKYNSSEEFDYDTGIHGHHVYHVTPQIWRTEVPDKYKESFVGQLEDVIIKLGFNPFI